MKRRVKPVKCVKEFLMKHNKYTHLRLLNYTVIMSDPVDTVEPL